VAERELRQTFKPIFDDQVNKELVQKLKTLAEKQLHARSELDQFKYEVKKEKIEL
jgi:hypothetical protein